MLFPKSPLKYVEIDIKIRELASEAITTQSDIDSFKKIIVVEEFHKY